MDARKVERRRIVNVRARIIEYFTLRDALLAAETIGDAARREAVGAFVEAREKRVAAEALLLQGSYASATRLASESAARMERALDGVGAADEAAKLRAAAAKLGAAPTLDADITRAQATAAARLMAVEQSLERRAEGKLLDRAGLLRLRVVHWLRAAGCAAFVLALATLVRGAVFGPRAEASSEFSSIYGAERAIDGDAETDWAPQDGQAAWLEIRWRLSRRLRVIKLMNGKARFNSQTADVRAELYDQATLVRTVTGSFADTPPRSWLMLDAGGVRCDRIRLYVTAQKGKSPALSEVAVQ